MSQEVHNILYNLNAYDEAGAISRAAGGLQASNETLADALNRMMRIQPEPVRRVSSQPSILQRAFMGAAIAGRMRPAARGTVTRPGTHTRGTGREVRVDHRNAFLVRQAATESRAAVQAMNQQRARAARVQREAVQRQRSVARAQPARFRTADPSRRAKVKARLDRGGFVQRPTRPAAQPSRVSRRETQDDFFAALKQQEAATEAARVKAPRSVIDLLTSREQGIRQPRLGMDTMLDLHITAARHGELVRQHAESRGMTVSKYLREMKMELTHPGWRPLVSKTRMWGESPSNIIDFPIDPINNPEHRMLFDPAGHNIIHFPTPVPLHDIAVRAASGM